MGQKPSVHSQPRAGNVGGVARGKEAHGLRNILCGGEASERNPVQDPLLLGFRVGTTADVIPQQRAVGGARDYAVYADTVRGIIERNAPHESQEPAFARGIRGAARIGDKGMAGGANYNTPAVLLLHDRDDMLAAEKGAFEIDSVQALPFLLGRFYDGFIELDGGVGKEHIDPGIASHNGSHGLLNLTARADIGFEKERFAPLAQNQFCGFFPSRRVPVKHHDLGPFTSEQESSAAANARPAACDYHNLSRELAQFILPWVKWHSPRLFSTGCFDVPVADVDASGARDDTVRKFGETPAIVSEAFPRHIGRHAVITARNITPNPDQGGDPALQFLVDRILAAGEFTFVDAAQDLKPGKCLSHLHHVHARGYFHGSHTGYASFHKQRNQPPNGPIAVHYHDLDPMLAEHAGELPITRDKKFPEHGGRNKGCTLEGQVFAGETHVHVDLA